MAFGLVSLLWGLGFAPDLPTFFSEMVDGPPTVLLVGLYVVFLGACVSLIIGCHPRIASVLVWAGLMYFIDANPYVMNTGDHLLRAFAFFLILAPAGDTFAPWPLHLIRLQVSAVYLFGLWEKLKTEWWNDGSAVSLALNMTDYQRLRLPERLIDSTLVSEVLTFGTIALEVLIPLGLWSRRWRPWAFLAAVALHLSIDVTLDVGMFTFIMLLGLVAFIPDDVASAATMHPFIKRLTFASSPVDGTRRDLAVSA